jgi:hypothetical protein
LKRCDRFGRFIDDGTICLTNNAAEGSRRPTPGGPRRSDTKNLTAW